MRTQLWKILFLCVIFCDSSIARSQINKPNFEGDLIVKEINYYTRLTYNTQDTLINYYFYEIDNGILITEYAELGGHSFEKNYPKFRFIKQNDSLFLNYKNFEGKPMFKYLYPLNYNDTIRSFDNYQWYVYLESTESSIDIEEVDSSLPSLYNGYYFYSGDTTITLKNVAIDCYKIGMFYRHREFDRKKEILIEKTNLIPINKKSWSYHRYLKMKKELENNWLFLQESKVIEIDC